MSTSAGESTAASEPGDVVIHAARADDIDRVLHLLMHYDQPEAFLSLGVGMNRPTDQSCRRWWRRTAGR